MNRRNALGAAAALAGGMLTANATCAAADTPTTAAAKHPKDPTYKFRLEAATPRSYADGNIREHKVGNFPIAANLSAGSIRLAAGGIREPHWHPNSDEWLYVMAGLIRMTVVNGKGEAERFDCGPGDVAFTPQGFGHYVENVGDTECHVLVVHNNGDFSTVELSEWVGAGSPSVFASVLNIPETAFANMPKKRVYITKKKRKA